MPFRSLFKRRKSPSFTPIAPPPSPQEIMDVIDEVRGVQAIVARGPDGKMRRVIQKLPETPQEEARNKAAQELMSRASKNLLELREFDPYAVVDFAPVIETFANLNQEQADDLSQWADFGNIQEDVNKFKEMNTSLMEDRFRRQRGQLETDLARKGRSGGSYGQEQRARNNYYENLVRQQNEVNATQYGEDLANQRLNRNMAAYGVRQQGRENRLNAAEMEYNLKQQQLQDLENRRRYAIDENMQQFGLGAQISGQDLAKAMASNAPELANQTFAMQSADSLNRYNADINRQNINYANRLARYNVRPPTFGEFLGNVAGQQLGTSITGPTRNQGQGNKGGTLSNMSKFFM